MNIFYLDSDPVKAAQFTKDKHCIKMIVESAQMLANCYTLEQLADSMCPRTQTGNVRRHSHYNHPCSKWVRESLENFDWLVDHAFALCDEYRLRCNKVHFTKPFLEWCLRYTPPLPSKNLTPPALAMPEKYHQPCPVESYRAYYMGEKQHLAKWTVRGKPDWYVGNAVHEQLL
jgi:hypothetical protein